MANKSLNGVLEHVRLVAAVHTYRDRADHDLLERFVKTGDEAAFTVLVERHGPMILGVCRRALGNVHDAEDVCQATFLVLARKAASVRKSTSLPSWLYGVACRVAAGLKRERVRRQRRERQRETAAPKDTGALVSWRELRTILDEELEQIAERYRTPLILCYLEGKTRDEAAQEVGVPVTTLHGRLERGRSLLRGRLTQRGLTLSAALFTALLGESAGHAALPATFVVTSSRAALAVAGGQPITEVVSANVVTLTQGVLKNMLLTKLKLGTAWLMCACLVAAVTCSSWTSVGSAQDVPLQGSKALQPSPAKTETDADFLRRVSVDLRGVEPSPAERHFFVASKDTGKRQKVIDLFIQERQAKKPQKERALADLEDLILREYQAELQTERKAARSARFRLLMQAASEAVSDEDFLRRAWLDLTGKLPSPEEVDRFLKNKDPDKRTRTIDKLLKSDQLVPVWNLFWREIMAAPKSTPTGLGTLQQDFIKELLGAKDKGDTARIGQAHLDRLLGYAKEFPKNPDVPDAIQQIVTVYESQGKTVEANAWRDKLRKEHPHHPASKAAKYNAASAP
jgi:RNA polymerase sigma factor (sigma-70 family)